MLESGVHELMLLRKWMMGPIFCTTIHPLYEHDGLARWGLEALAGAGTASRLTAD